MKVTKGNKILSVLLGLVIGGIVTSIAYNAFLYSMIYG